MTFYFWINNIILGIITLKFVLIFITNDFLHQLFKWQILVLGPFWRRGQSKNSTQVKQIWLKVYREVSSESFTVEKAELFSSDRWGIYVLYLQNTTQNNSTQLQVLKRARESQVRTWRSSALPLGGADWYASADSTTVLLGHVLDSTALAGALLNLKLTQPERRNFCFVHCTIPNIKNWARKILRIQ